MSGSGSESRPPLAPAVRTVSENGEDMCLVCQDPILIYAIGPCDHPICHICSTRMRVLCERNDCPICRGANPQVAFVCHKQPFQDIKLRNCIPNRKYKIFFEDEEVEDTFLELLEYRCKLCPKRGPEKTFAALQTHMRREHQLFACDLCVTHLKIFPYERKFYTRKNLATHRRIGDHDDKSYKGHPLCEFCDVRYFDKDELLKHLRKDHYFCHFCDQQGSNAYYDQYPDLLKHFSESHFLCTEGECGHHSTQFTHAFASEIDLKAHKASVHGKNFTKAQSREARTIDVEFQLPPRRQNRGGDYTDTRNSQGSRGYHRRRDHNQDDIDLQRALEASKESFMVSQSAESQPPAEERVPDPVHDFPSLGGASASTIPTTVQAVKSPQEDFPSLSSARGNGSAATGRRQAPVPNKAYATVMNPPVQPKPAPVAVRNESKPVPLGHVSSSARVIPPRVGAPSSCEDEYPTLGATASRPVTSTQGTWLSKSAAGSNGAAATVAGSKTLAISKVPSKAVKTAAFKKPISDENEFPSLGGQGRKKPRDSANPFTEWSAVQNGHTKKPAVTPKSERFDDDSFEMPDCCYTSHKDPTESSNISLIEKAPEPVVKFPSKPAPNNSTKDFPGLPAREKKTLEVVTEKKKKKNNKKTKVKENPQDKNSPVDGNASLSEIALGLMLPAAQSKSNKHSVTDAKHAGKKPTDWFDSPPEEVTQKTTPPQKQQHQHNGVARPPVHAFPISSSEESSSGSLDDSFPSLHSMSTAVQPQPQQKSQSKPPGFSEAFLSKTPSPPSQAPKPPPGFGTATTAMDLKSISSALTSVPAPPPGFSPNAVYVEPPEFKKRNTQLIADIRGALETVEDGFNNFRALSGYYRQGLMESSEYYDGIRSLLGEEDFVCIFPELLALLPDVAKQKQLWQVHQAAAKGKGNSSKAKRKHLPEVWQCPKCGQVTLSIDQQHHQLQCLTNADDFPTLNGAGLDNIGGKATMNGSYEPSSFKMNGSWIKAK